MANASAAQLRLMSDLKAIKQSPPEVRALFLLFTHEVDGHWSVLSLHHAMLG
jgi:hypothetical protein